MKGKSTEKEEIILIQTELFDSEKYGLCCVVYVVEQASNIVFAEYLEGLWQLDCEHTQLIFAACEGLPNAPQYDSADFNGKAIDNTEYSVELSADDLNVEVTAINYRTPFYVPQTGDGRMNPRFWAILAVVCGCAGVSLIAVTLVKRRKK